jgi:predicted phage tail component-like protein
VHGDKGWYFVVQHNQGYEVIYDGISSTTIPEYLCESVERQMVGGRRQSYEEVAGLDGAWLFPESPGLREIVIHSHVISDTWPLDRRAAVREVANWVDKSTWAKLSIEDEPGVYNMAILSEAPNVVEWRQVGTFDLTFMASPYTFASVISQDIEVASSATDTFNITVDGDVYSEPVIVITAGAGLNDVALELNGRILVYDEAIAAAGKITINSISKTVTLGDSIDTDLTGLFDPDDVSMVNVSGLFPYLVNGLNVLTVEGSASGYTVDVKWRNRYR